MGKIYNAHMLAKARRKYGKPQYPEKRYKKQVVEIAVEKRLTDWELIMKELQEQVSHISFETWIEPCKLLKMTEEKIVLGVESIFVRDMLEKRYIALMQKTAEHILGRPIRFELIVSDNGRY